MIYHSFMEAQRAADELNEMPGFPRAAVYHCSQDGHIGGCGAYTVVRAYRHPWAGNAMLVEPEAIA